MYMMRATRKRRWTIASARAGLTKLVASAAREPQPVYRRDKLVAAVVGPDLAKAITQSGRGERPTLAEAFAELRELCAAEDYTLVAPRRRDRALRPRRRR